MQLIYGSNKAFPMLIWLTLTGLVNASNAQEVMPCKPLAQLSGNMGSGAARARIEPKSNGKYCLTQDIKVGKRFVFSEGGERSVGGVILSIDSDGVLIDLQAHELDAEGMGTSGVDGGMRNITLKNGRIKSRTGWGVKYGDFFGHYFGSLKSDFSLVFGRYEEKAIKADSVNDVLILKEEVAVPLMRLRSNFPEAGHKLTLLNIQVGSSEVHPKRKVWQNGIAIKGAANVIQGNNISIYEGHAGIYLFGPNQVIENNTITFKGQPATLSGAPIKIHLADNTIIRNNTIIIEGGGDKPDAAISIIDSKNVVIENNKIIGTKMLYKIWDEEPEQKSSVIERGNEFVSWWGRLFGK